MTATKKTYYHNVVGSRYVARDGSEHIFFGGQLTTEDANVQAELDEAIAKCPGFPIRNQPRAAAIDKAALAAVVQVKEAAAKAVELAAKPAV